MKFYNPTLLLGLKRFMHYWGIGAICSTVTLNSGFFIWSLLIVSVTSLLLSIDDLATRKRLKYYPPSFSWLYLGSCIIAAALTTLINLLFY